MRPGKLCRDGWKISFKTRAEKVMFVKGDDNVPFADVANVIDIAHSAGVDKVGLITAKIEAGG